MKRILISTSVNSNIEYTFYVPYFIQFWLSMNKSQSIYQFIPQVTFVNCSAKKYSKYSNFIKEIFIASTLSDVLLSQIARILVAAESAEDFVITTDIDMLPISPKPFVFALNQIKMKDSEFVIMRNVLESGQFPICYNIASPKVWEKLIYFECGSKDFNMQIQYFEKVKISEDDWFTDQVFIFNMLTSQDFVRVTKLDDFVTGLRRLDREKHKSPINWLFLPLVYLRFFTEYHAPRKSKLTWLYLRILILALRVPK